tara:strand:+ start:2219 stop:2929 length:711 start_codon:yes stop_codon:yes gene_type:complete
MPIQRASTKFKENMGVGTTNPSHPLHIVTSTDGSGLSGDDKWAAIIQNAEATDGRSYGLKIMAGSTTDQAFAITDHDGSNDLMAVDGYGHITKPKQPAFLAHPSSTVTDMAVNTTHTLLFQTEVADRNADFDGSTGIFTAPVTGLYHFSVLLRLQEMNHGYSIVHCKLITSNSSNYIWIMDMRYGDANPDYFPLAFSTMADMDAGDTAKVQLFIPNYSSAQVDFREESWFSGYLVC